jgi:hypothetical protein
MSPPLRSQAEQILLPQCGCQPAKGQARPLWYLMKLDPNAPILRLGIVCAALLLNGRARADLVFLNPSADATLLEVSPDNSIGGLDFFIAGTTQNNTRNRALVRFDISLIIPVGSTINAVNLDVEAIHQPGCGFEALNVGLHRVLQPWGEGNTLPDDNRGGRGGPAQVGDATWLYRHAFDDTWALPGGAPGTDYVEELSAATFVFATDVYQFEGTAQMQADVQFWADHPESNFGWMFIAENEDTAFTARGFASRENGGGGPVLAIDFTPVPEPSTVVLLLAGFCALLGTHWCRGRRVMRDT